MGRRRCALLLAGILSLALAQGAGANHALEGPVSVGPTGGNGAFSASYGGASEDGSRVFFATSESLVAADTDGRRDLYQRLGTTTTLLSIGPAGGNGAFDAFFEGASLDGSRVFFTTGERLVSSDTDSQFDLYERTGGQTNHLSIGPSGGNGSFGAFFDGASEDGTRVFFTTNERLTSTDTDPNRQDVYERLGATTTQLSTGGNGDFDAFFDGSSADGTRVFFRSFEKLAGGDTDNVQDIFERSSGGSISRVSVGQVGGNAAHGASFVGASADGSRVFFTSREPLTSGETDGGCHYVGNTVPCLDIYQRAAGATTLVSTGPSGSNGVFDATFAGASRDGTRIFFHTEGTLLGSDTDARQDIYERSSGTTTTHVSTGGNGPYPASFAGASQDGTRVFFETDEPLGGADGDDRQDVYERSGGETVRVSKGPGGGNAPLFDAAFEGASADGARVFFHTDESLAGGDSDGRRDIYERFASETTLVSESLVSGFAVDAFFAGSSRDGSRAFIRTTDQLTGADTDGQQDIYAARAITYDHPSAASPVTVELVPTFRATISSAQCTARGGAPSSHEPPWAFESCNPPAYAPGVSARLGPQAVGTATIAAVPGNLGTTADEADIAVTAGVTDVRDGNSVGPDYDPNPSGADIAVIFKLRMTDRYNGPNLIDSATVSDFDFEVPASCTATIGLEGANCSANSSADAITPGSIKEGMGAVLQVFRVRVNDAGVNDVQGDGDDRPFAIQGLYVP